MAIIKDVTIRIRVDDKGVVQLDESFDQVNKKVKKTEGTMDSLRKSVLKLGTSLVGAFAIKAVVSDAIRTIVQFDQAIADLGAITGTTGKSLDAFKKQVLAVSAATGKGASEIAKAFQIVGSAQPELLKSAKALGEVTKQAVLLAQSGGLDVPNAANALTLAMNQFGASAKDAAAFTDILANSQQKGTATIEQLAEALINSGAVANSVGLSFEETNVALQAMAKGGLIGSIAGTGLAGVLKKLATQSRDDLNPELHSMAEITRTLSDENLDLKQATKLVGEEHAKSLLTLTSQVEVVENLTGALNDQGAAADQAAQKMDTMSGRAEQMGSAWHRYILSLEDGSGPIGGVIKDLQSMTLAMFDNSRIAKELSEVGLDKGFFQYNWNDNQVAAGKFRRRLEEANTVFTLSGASAEEYADRMEMIKEKMDKADRSTELGNAQFILLRKSLIELGTEYGELDKSIPVTTENLDEDTDATNKNTQSKKDQKAALDAIKQSFTELKAVTDDNIQADKDDNNSDFMKSVGLDDKSIEDYTQKLEERRAIKEDDDIKSLESKIEYDNLTIEQEQAIADSRMLIDQEIKENKFNAAFDIAGAASGLIENQLASLAVEKAIAIAQTIIMGNVAATAALAPPPIGAGPILGIPIAAGIKTNALISAALIGATAIPQIKKLKEGEVLISGNGTETSDSIPAMLSKNESIINAKSSKKHTAALKAINSDNFDSYLDRVVMQRLFMGQGNKKAQHIISKAESINFPSGFSVKNAKAISKPIVDAIEDSNFLKGAGWQ
jgi:TP901 family phage tail tape measure protein